MQYYTTTVVHCAGFSEILNSDSDRTTTAAASLRGGSSATKDDMSASCFMAQHQQQLLREQLTASYPVAPITVQTMGRRRQKSQLGTPGSCHRWAKLSTCVMIPVNKPTQLCVNDAIKTRRDAVSRTFLN